MKRITLITLGIVFTSMMYAYTDTTSVNMPTVKKKQSIDVVKQYMDSLKSAKYSLEELGLSNVKKIDNNLKPMEMNILTTPLTFYHGVANRLFGLQNSNAHQMSIDRSLMSIYIKHPEWIIDTEQRLSEEGGIEYKPNKPIVNDEEMTSHAEEVVIPKNQTNISEPVTLVTVRPNFWSYAGDYSLQFLQNYVSDNWYKGGESNYSMIGAATLQANYNDKEKIKWDNKLEMKLGMQSSQGDTLHNYKSSEDLIRLTSKLGVQATKKWYYTLQAIASTQFTHGYKANDQTVYSDFMSPLNVNLSLGDRKSVV